MPMTNAEIEQTLKKLRFSGVLATLEARAMQATQGEMSFMDTFSALLQDELDSRRSKLLERRYAVSGLRERTTMSGFDWSFNPKLPRGQILELMTCKFITEKESAVFIGSPGTGKSHVAKAVAIAAITQEMRVYYREAHVLFEELLEAKTMGTKKKLMNIIAESDLLIIDDLGLAKLTPENGEDILEIVMNRYERKSIMITSNRIVSDWDKMLCDATLASAVLDRVMHHCQLLKFEGKSYRLKEAASRLNSGGDGKKDAA